MHDTHTTQINAIKVDRSRINFGGNRIRMFLPTPVNSTTFDLLHKQQHISFGVFRFIQKYLINNLDQYKLVVCQLWFWCLIVSILPAPSDIALMLNIFMGTKNINSLSPRRNRHHFADDIFKCIFLIENVWILIEVPLKFCSWGAN